MQGPGDDKRMPWEIDADQAAADDAAHEAETLAVPTQAYASSTVRTEVLPAGPPSATQDNSSPYPDPPKRGRPGESGKPGFLDVRADQADHEVQEDQADQADQADQEGQADQVEQEDQEDQEVFL